MVEWYASPSANFPPRRRLNRDQEEEEDDEDYYRIDVSRFLPNSSRPNDDEIVFDNDGNELPKFEDEPCLESDEADPHRLARIMRRWKNGKQSKPEEAEPPPKQTLEPDPDDERMMQSVTEAVRLNKLMLEQTMKSSKQRSANKPATILPKKAPAEEKMTPITPRSYFAQRSVLPGPSQLPQKDKITVVPTGPVKRRLAEMTTSTPTSTSSKRFCTGVESFPEIDLSPIPCSETQREFKQTNPLVESPKARPRSKLRPNTRPGLRSALLNTKPPTTISTALSSKEVKPIKELPKETIAKPLPTTEAKPKAKPVKEDDDDFEWDD